MKAVLILVLVEDGLRVPLFPPISLFLPVLILVLVEDGLRDTTSIRMALRSIVLILVLVEDGLREFPCVHSMTETRSLNPCSCGRWSQRR